MKTIIITILVTLFLFFFGCKEEKKENVKTATTTSEILKTESSSKKETTDTALKQNGDYTSLFNRAPKDCSFITAQTLTTVIGVNKTAVKVESSTCTYLLTQENGQETRFHFVIEKWGNQKIKKEIKTAIENAENFGKDSTLSQYRISETGDTYLSMHQNRMVRILNEASDTVIVLLYTPTIDPAEPDQEKRKNLKEVARIQAYAITNYLLNTHKS